MTGQTAVFQGVGVALVTLFGDNGDVDVTATAAHARRMVDAGMRAVVVAGSTGEAATLDASERDALVGAVADVVSGEVPVIAGTGAPSGRQAVVYTSNAKAAGADAVLVLSPPGSRDLAAYYRAVVDAAGDMPVLGYHFPKMSAPGVPVDEMGALPVVGYKDSTGDPNRLLAEVATYRGLLYVGSSALLSMAGPLGVTGAILALANLEPELCLRAFDGDAKAQVELAPAHLAVEQGSVPALKRAMAERYGTSPVVRV